MGYLYITGTIFFTVYGQLILKWRLENYSDFPEGLFSKMLFLIKMILTDFWIFSGFFSAFLAALFWMLVLSKFELSFAYPFMALNFVVVFFLSIYLFGDSFNFYKIFGLVFIILGVFLSSKGI